MNGRTVRINGARALHKLFRSSTVDAADTALVVQEQGFEAVVQGAAFPQLVRFRGFHERPRVGGEPLKGASKLLDRHAQFGFAS